ncbi:MAG TPA: hypothetical protein VJ551_02255 [Nitrososphaeraceae archaeon]|nr:hypothetical protein [Nitrososphaeraceae archaeon]
MTICIILTDFFFCQDIFASWFGKRGSCFSPIDTIHNALVNNSYSLTAASDIKPSAYISKVRDHLDIQQFIIEVV